MSMFALTKCLIYKSNYTLGKQLCTEKNRLKLKYCNGGNYILFLTPPKSFYLITISLVSGNTAEDVILLFGWGK